MLVGLGFADCLKEADNFGLVENDSALLDKLPEFFKCDVSFAVRVDDIEGIDEGKPFVFSDEFLNLHSKLVVELCKVLELVDNFRGVYL
jgi:hypothetical protein